MRTLLKDKIFSVNNAQGKINEGKIKDWLVSSYNKIAFRPFQRTLIFNGYPYGTSYQFAEPNQSGDVFGDVFSHSISDCTQNVVLIGQGNNACVHNSLALGIYNLANNVKEGKKYIFSIGNGGGFGNRSNLFQVDTNGDVLSYSISRTQLDTSYVTTLGPHATLNDTLSGLLEETKYYQPQPEDFMVEIGGTNLPLEYSLDAPFNSKQPMNITLVWTNNKPCWEANYINDYITKNSKLPSNVNLSELSYTQYCNSIRSTGKISSTPAPDGRVTMVDANLQYNHSQMPNNNQIYSGKYAHVFPSLMPCIAEPFNTSSTAPGIYYIASNLSFEISYETPQISYYKQLADKNIFVKSDKYAFKKGVCKTTPITLAAYVGPIAYFGLFNIDENYDQNDIDKMMTYYDIYDVDYLHTLDDTFTYHNDGAYFSAARVVTSYSMNKYNICKDGVTFTSNIFNDHMLNTSDSKYHYIYFGLRNDFISDDGSTSAPNGPYYSIKLPNETVDAKLPSFSRNDNCIYRFDKTFDYHIYTFYIGKFRLNQSFKLATDTNTDDGIIIKLNNVTIDKGDELKKVNSIF